MYVIAPALRHGLAEPPPQFNRCFSLTLDHMGLCLLGQNFHEPRSSDDRDYLKYVTLGDPLLHAAEIQK